MTALEITSRKFYSVKAKYHFLRFMQDPTKTEDIFHMTAAYQKSTEPEQVEALLKPLLSIPELKVAYETRYWYQVPALAELNQYPEGSFGKAAADFFARGGLNIDFYPEPDFSSAESYITSRVYQAHDFWHVLTGYDTSLEGEIAIQAFMTGQNCMPLSVVIIAGALAHFIENNPERATDVMRTMSEAFQLGTRAKNLMAVPVLERLKEPLEQVRCDLNIKL
jgi:ubiquinone biosynthesis protein Coq4